MKICKLSVAALGLLALSACSQPPAPPAYVEVPWKGSITPAAAFAPVTFTIPFRTGSVHLSRTDLATIRDAADAFGKGGATVKVTGFTDTVGKNKANQKLSDRRASVVANALVKAGVPAGAIATVGVGETQLAVATGNNVNEKANRRVVIDVR
jgi:outer membrane protein OmpA-like peptidoglycan-associated protein